MAPPDATSEGEVRAGSLVLALFANPLNALILRAHADGPLRLNKLKEEINWVADTTLRAALTNLGEIGAFVRPEGGSRFAVENEPTEAGREMLFAADVVEAWLVRAPGGPIALESEAAKGAVKALSGGWGSTLMRSLANRPFTLTELDSLIPGVSYPSLERRIARMRSTGLIEAVGAGGRGTPYIVTDWSRQSRRWSLPGAASAATFRTAARRSPTSRSRRPSCWRSVSSPCRKPPAGPACWRCIRKRRRPTSTAAISPTSSSRSVAARSSPARPRSRRSPPAWALGSAEEWLDVVIDGDLETLRFGGARPQLALDLVSGLHFALFGG